ncbi:hypothetical protein LDENG_00199260 [Lucifuga dentata]|nr:hypothetical protein LDENG_00199260 [Lucifuga dentata]
MIVDWRRRSVANHTEHPQCCCGQSEQHQVPWSEHRGGLHLNHQHHLHHPPRRSRVVSTAHTG